MTLKLKIGKTVPPSGVPVAFVRAPALSVVDNLAIADLSSQEADNLTGRINETVHVDYVNERISDEEVVLGNRAVLSLDVRDPKYLYFAHQLGSNTALTHLATEEFGVFSEIANSSDLVAARSDLKHTMRILDLHGQVPQYLSWDIEVLSHTPAAGMVPAYFTVRLYTSHQTRRNRSFRIQYNAVNVNTGEVVYNHLEAVNAQPYFVRKFRGVGAELDYKLSLQTDNSIKIDEGLDAFTAAEFADAIGLFHIGSGGKYSIVDSGGGVMVLHLDPSGVDDTVTITGKTIKEAVTEVNLLNNFFKAVPLATGRLEDGEITALGITDVTKNGVTIKHDNHFNVLIPNPTRIFATRPIDDVSNIKAWFPRINVGRFHTSKTASTTMVQLRYSIPEYETQLFSEFHLDGTGQGILYRDVFGAQAAPFNSGVLFLENEDVLASSIVLADRDGVDITDIVGDYDASAGILYLNKLLPDGKITLANYAYADAHLVYTDVDLNPTQHLNPDIFGKFVGIYIIPSEYEEELPGATKSGFLSRDRTVYHTIQDSFQDVVDVVDALALDPLNPAFAFLLAVFQVTQSQGLSEMDVLDVRRPGGGVRDDAELEVKRQQNPEVDFVAGFKADGEPYPGSGILIVTVPDAVIENKDITEVADDPDLGSGDWVDPTARHTATQVKEKVLKYVTFGTFPIVEYRNDG